MGFCLSGFYSWWVVVTVEGRTVGERTSSMESSAFSYQKFVQFAVQEAQRFTSLLPLPLPERYKCMKAMDGKTELCALSFQAPKIRMLRSLTIEESQSLQVLDFAAFPEPEFDLPIFCGNFVSTSVMNIVVLDLNPLHDVTEKQEYKEKYYDTLLPLGQKYIELLPWGSKITSESLRFFSPIVIWTKFKTSESKHNILYSAFKDYFKAWLQLVDQALEEKDASQTLQNVEAQHRYLTWRAEKDPGHHLLTKLVGEEHAKELLRSFLFNGVDTIGSKTFVDYFPEYRCEDGTINKKRSILGKSFESRPWNLKGEFTGNDVG